MRHVQVTVPVGKRDVVLDLLDEEGIDYVLMEEESRQEYEAVVEFGLPSTAVEPVLDALQEAGLEQESYTVVVDARTVISEQFDELQRRFATETVEEEQISRQELVSRAEELTPTFSVFVMMTLISTVVATAGLLLDSPAVVVGSMVIAPLIGPALAASVGTVVNERELFFTGVRYQIAGVVVGIIGAAIFAWILQTLFLVPPGTEITEIGEVAERVTPELLLLPVALGAGVAGVFSLTTGFSVALVGVMIAAALVPPIAAAGIALAWGLPAAALGSTVLVLVNLLGVNLAGLLTLWYTGYRPGSWFEISTVHRQLLYQISVLALAVFALSLFLGGTTYTTYQISTFEQTVTQEAEAALEEYDDLEVLSVNVQIRDQSTPIDPSFDVSDQVDVVVVEVGGPREAHDPAVIDDLYRRINQPNMENVTVQVRFTTTGERGPPPDRDLVPEERIGGAPGARAAPAA